MAFNDDRPRYFSFLMRLWVVRQDNQRIWRVSLENPQTREILGFETLQELYGYLEALTNKDDKEGYM